MQIWEWCTLHKTELIITGVVIAVLVIIIGIIIGVHSHKKRILDRRNIGKILLTTEGFLGNYPANTKPRRVIVVLQRKKDGAIAIAKVFKYEGKEEKVGKTFIPDLILSPTEHSSLQKPSIVGRQVFFGIAIKKDGEKTYKPFYMRDFEITGDVLTDSELEQVLKEVSNFKPQFRKTYKKTAKKWKKGFKGIKSKKQ